MKYNTKAFIWAIAIALQALCWGFSITVVLKVYGNGPVFLAFVMASGISIIAIIRTTTIDNPEKNNIEEVKRKEMKKKEQRYDTPGIYFVLLAMNLVGIYIGWEMLRLGRAEYIWTVIASWAIGNIAFWIVGIIWKLEHRNNKEAEKK